ncbi:MAG: hypothetical protein CMJ46_03010 [Planctomyces sp.]|nr:hypothetical protein [Planctomyces sp.]
MQTNSGFLELLIVFFAAAGGFLFFLKASPKTRKRAGIGLGVLLSLSIVSILLAFVAVPAPRVVPAEEVSVVDMPGAHSQIAQNPPGQQIIQRSAIETWAAIASLVSILVLASFAIWLFLRSDKFRAVAMSLLCGIAVLGVLFVAGKFVSHVQHDAMQTTATITNEGAEPIVASHPNDVTSFMTGWFQVYFTIALAASIIVSFFTYVYLVSRKPATELKSTRFLQSALWGLPVVLVCGMVVLTYIGHLQESAAASRGKFGHTIQANPTSDDSYQIDPAHGGFLPGMVLEVHNDLPLKELEEKVTPLPTDAAGEANSTDSVAPAETPAITVSYPEWIPEGGDVRLFERENGKVFRFTIMSDLFDSNRAAVEDALSRLSRETVNIYSIETRGTASSEIPTAFLRDSAIVHTYGVSGLVATDGQKFPMYRVWLDCEVTTAPDSPSFQYWKSVLMQYRMWILASLIGFFVLVFVALSGLLRLNHFSHGQFEKRLKLAYIILVLVAGIGVMTLMA